MAAMNPAGADIPRGHRPATAVASPDGATAGIEAVAFATDSDSEHALREGLSGLQEAVVWPGGLRAAIAALGNGHSARLLFVDIDGIPYPAGAIYELSRVCEVGSVVVAFGSDRSARFSREILLAGVSDYLVKPITATSVREVVARVIGTAAHDAREGWLVGFAGTGGSGATTLAAAVALLAAERGRYVSVLDLNRTFSVLSFLLDVEPAGGLVDLLSTVARASLHPEMVDGMRAERSDRIAVYGYAWSGEPPPPAPVWAVCELFVELQRRSHLVIVDGMDDVATRQSLLAMVDARVLVVEPTVIGAAAAARMMARLGPMRGEEWPTVLVQNHTRDFPAERAARGLARAGVAPAADVVVPFAPTLTAVTNRGCPQGQLPRIVRQPLDAIVNRILSMPGGAANTADARGLDAAPVASRTPPAGESRSRTARGLAAVFRPSAVRTALRRILGSRGARTRTA